MKLYEYIQRAVHNDGLEPPSREVIESILQFLVGPPHYMEEFHMEAKTQGYGTIGWAVSAMRYSYKARPKGWPSSKQYVAYVPAGSVQIPQKFGGGEQVAEWLVISIGGELQSWQASSADLLADDWEVIDAVEPGVYTVEKPQVA